jgi:hypothetical protein
MRGSQLLSALALVGTAATGLSAASEVRRLDDGRRDHLPQDRKEVGLAGDLEESSPRGVEATPALLPPVRESLVGTRGTVAHSLTIPSLVGREKGSLRVVFSDVWSEERGGPFAIRIVSEGREYKIEARRENRPTFAIPASEHGVQRFVVDGRPVWTHVLPNEEVIFHPNPCNGWGLSSRRLDMTRSGRRLVRFRLEKGGTAEIGYFADSKFHVLRRVDAPPEGTSEFYSVASGACQYPVVRIGEEMILAMSVGAKWTISLSADGETTVAAEEGIQEPHRKSPRNPVRP